MRILIGLSLVVIFAGAASAEDAAPPWQIEGRVVDEAGRTVEGYTAASFWLSNGNWWDDKGQLLAEANAGKLWTNEGSLAASPSKIATRINAGRFRLTDEAGPPLPIYAIDSRHERGGIFLVDESWGQKSVTITMASLVQVTAKVYCSEAGRVPEWSQAAVYVPDGNGQHCKLSICGSFRGAICFKLPPGKYDLEVDSQAPAASLQPRPQPLEKGAAADLPKLGIRFEVPSGRPKLDLGVLDLALARGKCGKVSDVSQWYGSVPPTFQITDARGVAKTVQLADFRGKWVLLEFWAAWCGPCVYQGLPELTKFCEEHAEDRDRFEVLAICNTEQERALTVEAYEALTAPLVKDAWGGQDLKFPVLVDGEGNTSDAYGIQGWPTVLLIDPEGKLVKDGGLEMLGERLGAEQQ